MTEMYVVHVGEHQVNEVTYHYKIDWYKDELYHHSLDLIHEEFTEMILQMAKKQWKAEHIKGKIVFADKGYTIEERVRNYEP